MFHDASKDGFYFRTQRAKPIHKPSETRAFLNSFVNPVGTTQKRTRGRDKGQGGPQTKNANKKQANKQTRACWRAPHLAIFTEPRLSCVRAPASVAVFAAAGKRKRKPTNASHRLAPVTIARRPAACLSLLPLTQVLCCVAPILVLARATLAAAKQLVLRMFYRAHATHKPLHEPVAAAAAAHASTTGSALSSPLLVVSGLSAMRDAEPTTSAHILMRPAYADATMAIRHDTSSHNSSAGPTENPVADATTSPILIGRGSGHRVKPFAGVMDVDAAHQHLQDARQAHMTRSLTSQQDLLDQRRSSFCSMSADGRAQLRRRSHDNLDFTSMSLPPQGSGPGFLQQTRSKNHSHMRAHGRMDLETKRLTARQEEGAALVDVVIPSTRTIWRRGQPVCIEWRVLDEKVDTVQIELMEEGSSATTTIARAATNSGFYTYPRVPWGMQCGPTYFLRISSTEDPTRYMTTSFFQIGSVP